MYLTCMLVPSVLPRSKVPTYPPTEYPRFVIAYPALHGGARGSPHNGACPTEVPIGSGDEQVIGKPCLRFRRFGHCVTRTWLAWVSEYIEVGVCLQQSIGHTLQYLDLDLGFSGLILRPFCDLCASSFQRLPTQHTRSAPRHSACQWLVTAAPSTTLPTNTLTEFPLFSSNTPLPRPESFLKEGNTVVSRPRLVRGVLRGQAGLVISRHWPLHQQLLS